MPIEKHSSYSKRLHYMGAVMWSSFLAACVATMVFFAMFDPEELSHITTWEIEINRQLGYTLGFFCFWFLTLLSSTCTLVLLLPGNKVGGKFVEPKND